ncbi:hypothetical protein E6P09_19260 (plasmid) [Haloferax mediterranei ATCC 33500]|uniref:Immunity protein Imm5 domain-containing protein n=1 Tax=Haloferax mediterranei (strain ATCC 33500 / DSM 1411 / JCM 8866 / NBRC 14739 / NCIMB 2177 / R-4) TaxID=523841 RepID=A0A4P8PGV9_HALMT|nr:hypothetical protein E6P09_19260 [Haloferax mediterranei ATCC 33500]
MGPFDLLVDLFQTVTGFRNRSDQRVRVVHPSHPYDDSGNRIANTVVSNEFHTSESIAERIYGPTPVPNRTEIREMHNYLVSMITSAAVQRYKASIRERDDCHFVLPLRKELWRSFGPVTRTGQSRAERTPAHTRRARLAITTCQKVLPIWEQQIPQSDIAQRSLRLAERYLAGDTDDETVREAVNRFVTGVENTAGTTAAELNAQLVGWACCEMLYLALFDCYVGEKTVHDAALDDWDYSLYAAGAYAGGFPFNEGEFQSDSDRLQEFWFWYVEQAHRIAE